MEPPDAQMQPWATRGFSTNQHTHHGDARAGSTSRGLVKDIQKLGRLKKPLTTKPATGNYVKPSQHDGHSQTSVMSRAAHQAIQIHKSFPITVALQPATNSSLSPPTKSQKKKKTTSIKQA